MVCLNFGPITYGGVFKDCRDWFFDGLCQDIGHRNSSFCITLRHYYWCGICFLERLALSLVRKSLFQYYFRFSIRMILILLVFFFSHIFRDGNVVADSFANIGMSSTNLVWQDSRLSILLCLQIMCACMDSALQTNVYPIMMYYFFSLWVLASSPLAFIL